jgi:hypothetical protein
MQTKATVLFGSLLGAFAIHVTLTACHGSGTSNANAQTNPCTSWKTAFVLQSVPSNVMNFNTAPMNQPLGAQALPSGWEPMQTEVVEDDGTTAQIVVHARQCTSSQ